MADTVKESSISAVERFRAMGIDTVMLTGDNRVTAEAIRKQLAIGDVIAEVLPAEKEAAIRGLQDRGHKVAMVGDGINDAPALMRADIGIAIGAGTDIAVESADIVLMKDSLEDVAEAIALSRAVVNSEIARLFWAFFYNILGIPVRGGSSVPGLWHKSQSNDRLSSHEHELRMRCYQRFEASLFRKKRQVRYDRE